MPISTIQIDFFNMQKYLLKLPQKRIKTSLKYRLKNYSRCFVKFIFLIGLGFKSHLSIRQFLKKPSVQKIGLGSSFFESDGLILTSNPPIISFKGQIINCDKLKIKSLYANILYY